MSQLIAFRPETGGLIQINNSRSGFVVTMSFFSFKIGAVVAIIVYVLGAATGGSLLALLRRSHRSA